MRARTAATRRCHVVKKILIGLGSLIALLVLVGFVLPSTAHVERRTTIEAPAAAIFPWLNDFKKFNEWSPWAERDPNMKREFSGPSSGVGATLSWEGDPDEVGSGTQKIVESVPDKRVVTELDFGDQGGGKASFDLVESDGKTEVTWAFDTDFGMNLVGRYFGLMFDGMIGPDYEAGLAKLKRTVESQPVPAPEPAPTEPVVADTSAQGAMPAGDEAAE